MELKLTKRALCAELCSMSPEQGSAWTAREWISAQQRADFMEHQENQAKGVLEIIQRRDLCSGMIINGCRSEGGRVTPSASCSGVQGLGSLQVRNA